jgi:hypothetical protein
MWKYEDALSYWSSMQLGKYSSRIGMRNFYNISMYTTTVMELLEIKKERTKFSVLIDPKMYLISEYLLYFEQLRADRGFPIF